MPAILHSQPAGELVIPLHSDCAHVLFDATSFNACGQPRTDLLGQLWRHRLAQKSSDPISIGSEDGLARDRVVEWHQNLLAAKHQVGGVFGLTDAPVIIVSEHVKNGAQPLRIAIGAAAYLVKKGQAAAEAVAGIMAVCAATLA